MNVLALDSCFGAVSVAVAWLRDRDVPGRVVRERYEVLATGHAERLMPMIAEVMEEAQLEGGPGFAALDRIAVTTGPGTFTGVRTGIAAARALALATGKPVCGASSLVVMMRRVAMELDQRRQQRVAIAVDARRGEVYLQCFEGVGARALSGPQLLPIARAVTLLETFGRAWIAAGSGGSLLAAAADQLELEVDAVFPALEPHASDLAHMADELPVLSTVTPLYLRPPDAKPQMSKILPRA